MRRRYVVDLLRAFAALTSLPHRFRPAILRLSGVSIGSSCLIMAGLRIPRHANLSIGNDVFINYDCYFDLNADVVIGNGVRIADHVRLLTGTHLVGENDRRAGSLIMKPVVIGDGCWIGSSVTVLPGVTVGRGCVIAAGSVVIRDCDQDGLYAGVPAVRLRSGSF